MIRGQRTLNRRQIIFYLQLWLKKKRLAIVQDVVLYQVFLPTLFSLVLIAIEHEAYELVDRTTIPSQ